MIPSTILERPLYEQTFPEQTRVARTSALQAQIHPHFLFNTLSSIAALIEFDPAAARQMIGTLAGLFRYTQACLNIEQVSLSDELAFVSEYLAIERARLGMRLRCELPLVEDGRGVRLPGLTLQPLVENAIRYGIARRIEGGVIRIALDRNAAECRIRISNQAADDTDTSAIVVPALFRAGHAMANIRDRLALCYSGGASLTLTSDRGGWVHATVTVPILTGE